MVWSKVRPAGRGSARPGRILGSVPSVTGQAEQLTSGIGILHNGIGPAIVRRYPRLLASLNSIGETVKMLITAVPNILYW